jgi:hypothetical protein
MNQQMAISEMGFDLFGHQIKLAELLDKLDAHRDREQDLRRDIERKQVRSISLLSALGHRASLSSNTCEPGCCQDQRENAGHLQGYENCTSHINS